MDIVISHIVNIFDYIFFPFTIIENIIDKYFYYIIIIWIPFSIYLMNKNKLSLKKIFFTKKFLNRLEFFIGLSLIIILSRISTDFLMFIFKFLKFDIFNQTTSIFINIINIIISGYIYYLLFKIANKRINSYSKNGNIFISGIIIIQYIINVIIYIFFIRFNIYIFYYLASLPNFFDLSIEILNIIFYISIIYLLFKKENPKIIDDIINTKQVKKLFENHNGEYCDLLKKY